jgi:hypothetical protein
MLKVTKVILGVAILVGVAIIGVIALILHYFFGIFSSIIGFSIIGFIVAIIGVIAAIITIVEHYERKQKTYANAKVVQWLREKLFSPAPSPLEESKRKTYANAKVVQWLREKLFPPYLPPLEESEEPVPFDSNFYVERPPIESDCYKTIMQPGALIRIKAPRQMGKSSLMTRILEHANQQGCQPVQLYFREAEKRALSDLEQFLRWFCTMVTEELKLPNKLEDYWKVTYEGSKDKCKNYFQHHLLKSDSPVVLGLNKVELVFQYPEIATEFFGLLRAWHERGKNDAVWKKLRLIIVYSEEINFPLDINQSPFNVGTHVELPELNSLQVQDLAQRHELDWSQDQVEQLMNLVGGHPYLVRVALDQIAENRITLERLLQVAPKQNGPYSDHLRNLLSTLKDNANLAKAFKQVITANSPIDKIDDEVLKLRSMGLVKFLDDDTVVPLCDLYHLYFRKRI